MTTVEVKVRYNDKDKLKEAVDQFIMTRVEIVDFINHEYAVLRITPAADLLEELVNIGRILKVFDK